MEEIYKVKIEKLINATNKTIISELGIHREAGSTPIKFPSTFYVKINLDTDDDTNGLQYFKSLEDEKPFLIMGYSDNGFLPIVGLLKLAGMKK